jgi:hypothetical protein
MKDEGRMMNDETKPSQRARQFRASSFFIHTSAFQSGGSPRSCTVFRPGKSRSFTRKVCDPSEREGGVEPPRRSL